MCFNRENVEQKSWRMIKRGWDKSPSLSIVYGLSSKTQWLSAQSTALRWRIELAKQVS